MTPSATHVEPRPDSDPDLELDGYVAAFEAAAASDPAADPVAFAPPPDHPLHAAVACELVRVALEVAWDRGVPRRADDYRGRLPALFAHPSLVAAVVREEVRLRAATGGEMEPDDDPGRTDRADDGSATRTVAAGRSPAADRGRLPEPGETVAGFTLVSELGRGAFGRVFLARQADLADRFVALKVSARFPGEWQTLARLQHTNVVPVYSAHRHGRFHVACMPFHGRTTLADVIRDLRAGGAYPAAPPRASASTTPGRTDAPATTPAGGTAVTTDALPAAATPAPANRPLPPTYVEWALRVGAELADGLAHAHERGVLHRDVKPANVLLADDGRPMLLDFNLADDAADPDGGKAAGGTVRYMAPEQLASLADPAVRPDVRADVYSLAVVLFELLAGRLPFDDPAGQPLARVRAARLAAPADVRTFRPEASPAVASLLRTALDPDVARRYPSAADFRDDLRRQLEHRPLAFAPDRSVRERFRKWRRRHPRLASWATVSTLAGVVLAAVVVGFLARQRHFDRIAAENHLARVADARGEVRAMLATRGPASETADVRAKCRTVLAGLPGPSDPAFDDHPFVAPLASADRERLREAVRAFALFDRMAAALEPGSKATDAERQQAAEVVAAAVGEEVDVAAFGAANTRAKAAALLPAFRELAVSEAGRWEYWHRLGRYEHLAADLPAARSHLALAGQLNRLSPWPHYHLGLAALDANDPNAAVAAFDACLAVRDDIPEAYFNRAVAKLAANDPRGAVADLDRIESHASELPRLYFVREAANRRLDETEQADRDRAAGLKLEPTDAAGWNARGEAKLSLVPPDAKGAAADFRRGVDADPDVPQSYQNLANLLSETLGKPADAIKVLDEAVERFPDYVPARAGRAVLLARGGNADAARRDAGKLLTRNPPAVVCYQTACVYLLTAKTDDDRAKGIDLLRRTLRLDPTWAASMPADPDLKAVWKAADFERLLRAARDLAPDVPR